MSEWSIRAPAAEDMPVLADIWHDGWHEVHAMHVPAGLVAVRTREDFRRRLAKMLVRTGVIGPIGEPLGLCTIREDELMHLFVASAARGAGHAIALLRDGEARLRSAGIRTAWLSCTIGNAELPGSMSAKVGCDPAKSSTWPKRRRELCH